MVVLSSSYGYFQEYISTANILSFMRDAYYTFRNQICFTIAPLLNPPMLLIAVVVDVYKLTF